MNKKIGLLLNHDIKANSIIYLLRRQIYGVCLFYLFLFRKGGRKVKKEFKQILIVKNIVNNNIVIAKDFYGREVIAIGKGLGFRKHKNEAVYPEEITKTYISVDKPNYAVFTLLEEIPFEVIEISQKIIDYAEEHLKGTFNVNFLMTLADHIHFSIVQYHQGNQTPKLLNEEVKRFYREEYNVAQKAVTMINEQFAIDLPKDEVTAIAFHLSTATENKSNPQMLQIMRAVSDIVKIVEQHLGCPLDEHSLTYSRFIIHLKLFLRNVLSDQAAHNEVSFASIFNQLKTEYEQSLECVKSISDYVMEHYNYLCTDEDCIYLMIDIVHLYERSKS